MATEVLICIIDWWNVLEAKSTQNQSPYASRSFVSVSKNHLSVEFIYHYSYIFLTKSLHIHDPCSIFKLSALASCIYMVYNPLAESRVLGLYFWAFLVQVKSRPLMDIDVLRMSRRTCPWYWIVFL